MSHTPKLVVLLLWCIGSAFPVFAQAYHLSIPVTDSTGSSSPLAIRGDVSFQVQVSPDEVKTEWDMNVSLTNISSKPIIAYEVSIEAMPDQGPGVHFLDQVDHFFRPTLSFLPGAQELITGGLLGFRRPRLARRAPSQRTPRLSRKYCLLNSRMGPNSDEATGERTYRQPGK